MYKYIYGCLPLYYFVCGRYKRNARTHTEEDLFKYIRGVRCGEVERRR